MGEATSCEVNGFVGWLASFAALIAYFFWALCSTQQLNQLGVTYYPDRYWALALPVMILVVLAIVFFSYAFINILYAPPPDSVKQFTDKRVQAPSPAAKQALQLMAAAAAAAVTAAAATVGRRFFPKHLTCREALRDPILRSLQQQQQQQQKQQRYTRSGAVSDLPLSLVCRVLFPLNPHLEGRPCKIQGPPVFYQPIKLNSKP